MQHRLGTNQNTFRRVHWLVVFLVLTAVLLPRPFHTTVVHAEELDLRDPSAELILYDGSGLMSASAGFTLFGLPLFAWQESYSGGTTTLASTDSNSIQVGYNSRAAAVPALYRDLGYRLTFTAQLNSESHTSQHRAGFSVIVLDHASQGVELGFWPGEIWAQNDGSDGTSLFTHGEGAAWDTTAVTTYALEFIDDTYRLSANGSPILSGPVRDYTAFTGTIDPYENQNYIFMGDNTQSAQASVNLAQVALTTNTCAEHDSQPPALTAVVAGQTVNLSWTDAPRNFSYTAVRSTMPYTNIADATRLGATAELVAVDSDILAASNRAFYRVQESLCGAAVSNEVGVLSYAVNQGS